MLLYNTRVIRENLTLDTFERSKISIIYGSFLSRSRDRDGWYFETIYGAPLQNDLGQTAITIELSLFTEQGGDIHLTTGHLNPYKHAFTRLGDDDDFRTYSLLRNNVRYKHLKVLLGKR